jgi:hypothetical protein
MDPVALPVPHAPPPDAAIAALAARYRGANGGVMALVNGLGGQIEHQMQALPDSVRDRIDRAIRMALEGAYGAARLGAAGPAVGTRAQTALATLSGGLGGLGGLPTAIAELPVAVTLILRAIQRVAEAHGFDPSDPATRREVLRVFGAGSPLAADDGANSAFIGARLTLTGPALHRMIAAVVPRLAAALGQKLATQAVPVLGALAGAGLNAAYLSYYREMAEVRFGLLALARRHDPAAVLAAFRAAAEPPRLRRA